MEKQERGKQSKENNVRKRKSNEIAQNNDSNIKLRYPSHPPNCCHNVIRRR